MAISTSPVDRMLTSSVSTWFVISTVRIDDKLEDRSEAIQTSVVCCGVTRLVMTPQYLCTVCFYEGLNWNQQPAYITQQNNTWQHYLQHISRLEVWLIT